MKPTISECAENTLKSLEAAGLDTEQTAMVAAAVLCAVTVDVKVAHEMVAYIDLMAKLADKAEEGE